MLNDKLKAKIQEDIKEIVGLISKNLKEKGINVAHIGTIRIPKEPEDRRTKESDFGKDYNDFKNKEAIYENKTEKVVAGECKDGLTFDNFEKKLDEPGCTFDYHTMTLAGKEFSVKYWLSADEKVEQLVVAPNDSNKLKKSSDELLADLEDAYQDGNNLDFQNIINEIKKRII
jgi:hypothetical protein